MLNKHNLMVHKFAGDGNSRNALNVVQVTEKYTEATDGHRLIRIDRPKQEQGLNRLPDLEGFEPATEHDSFLLEAVEFKDLASRMKKKAKFPYEHLVGVGPSGNDHVELASFDKLPGRVLKVRKTGGEFPNFDDFLPETRETKPDAVFYMDAKLLADTLAVISAMIPENESHTVKMEVYTKREERKQRGDILATSKLVLKAKTEEGQEVLSMLMGLAMPEPKPKFDHSNCSPRICPDAEKAREETNKE